MYYPYFRGKQFELITIREMAPLIAKKGFVPIIEPVRESLNGLQKALKALSGNGGQAIVIVNPYYGDYQESGADITSFLKEACDDNSISAGVLLRSDMTVEQAMMCYREHADHDPVILHAGFTAPKQLADALANDMAEMTNIFVEDEDRLLYRKHFKKSRKILVRDGFKRQRNADYPPVEAFSDLHVTYPDRGMNGFGDFLIVGDAYSEGGGPAYAVAIHLTFIDPEQEDVMYIYHFLSRSNDSPADPAGKFGQAVANLVKCLDSGSSKLLETDAVKEFRSLHKKGHFPGLGYVKKLCMKHHIETLANFLG